jgi:uncharacterized protein YodC (DUF2158 family)
MTKLSNRLAELIERVTETPWAISQTLSASEWHELQTELSDFACDKQASPQIVEPFQVGDVVFLKSGSPPLVVTALPAHSNDGEIEKVTVTWLDAEHEGRVIVLPAICFMKDNPGWPGIGLWPFMHSANLVR